MKKFLLAGAALAALAVPAMAADLSPAPMYTKAPVPAPVFSWTGFYVGANIGGGWAQVTDSGTAAIPGVGTVSTSASSTTSGVIGGGQIGYNWQAGSFVFGVEADIDGSGEKSTNTGLCLTAGCVANGASGTATDKVEDFGTARGRIGLAFDRWMIYATGGASWQTINTSYAVTAAGVTTASANVTTTRAGYAVGGGVEAALWSKNWIGGLEYLYLDTGTFSTGTPCDDRPHPEQHPPGAPELQVLNSRRVSAETLLQGWRPIGRGTLAPVGQKAWARRKLRSGSRSGVPRSTVCWRALSRRRPSGMRFSRLK
jgi:outer membrane immunogenic protein